MNSYQIRQKFFDFFKSLGHEQVDSSSLIPAQDPTLLFTNAGMNQFKDLFLGNEKRSYKKAVTIQKCMRAGGKHNDLDNVGFTARHLTFFEMMGNFSFGDYFKNDAIRYAWDFLTKDLNLPVEKLHVTVFHDDNESYNIWKNEIGVASEKITKLSAVDNFWQMGDTGPCGPCTEIYIDRGEQFGENLKPGDEGERFLEIWNLVFMQFNRQEDGTDKPLAQKGVDTGMGLERLMMVLENKNSVYETSIFQEIIKEIEKLTGKKYQEKNLQPAFNVLADHIRASVFLLADGCSPSNDGRGYVLRKIIRRAALFEKKLTEKSIFSDLAKSVISSMKQVYPYLAENADYIVSVLQSEIEKFSYNLDRGRQLIAKMFTEQENKKIITGEEAFRLYDTFGFPTELIELVAKENNATVDFNGFDQEMEKQRIQSGKKIKEKNIELPEEIITKFTGYKSLEDNSKITAIIDNHNNIISLLEAGQTGWIIPEETPFFVECGGQVDDQGYVEINSKKEKLLGLKKINNAIAIQIEAPENISLGTKVKMVVNEDSRANTMKNHTATHLLQAALKDILGNQVKQSGSIVTPDYLRFDYTYHENLTAEQIKKVEQIVNKKIMENIPLNIYETTYNQAVKDGVTAIFGEKYNPECVRVIDIKEFSAELCGGTHVNRTGDIGVFKITESSALSAGNRRIVALTGPKALETFQNEFETTKVLSQHFKVPQYEVLAAVEKQTQEFKETRNIAEKLNKEILDFQIPEICNNIQTIENINLVAHEFKDIDNKSMQEVAQKISQKISGIAFVYTNNKEKSNFVLIAKKDLNLNLDVIKNILTDHGIRSGGNQNRLQGGGTIIDKNIIDAIIKVLK